MNVLMMTPWPNVWIPYYRAECDRRGHAFYNWTEDKERDIPKPDVVLHGWASVKLSGPPIESARNVYFLRGFEQFDGSFAQVPWERVDDLVCVNAFRARQVREHFEGAGIKTRVHVIYNGHDPARWTFKARRPGKNIGMVCYVHTKKNLPLAAQILAKLPQDYSLHIAGEVQDVCTADYIHNIAQACQRKVYFYGQIPHEQLNQWWDQMHICLSTSIREGNPNNVIEAMLKGIKPVVHNWPGAGGQFGPWVFNTVDEAVDAIMTPNYDSAGYREHAAEHFGLGNIARAVDIALEDKP